MKKEVWKPVLGWEETHKVSDRGRIRSLLTGNILKPTPTSNGYLCVTLNAHGIQTWRLVHQIVIEAFTGYCPVGQECRHRDGNGHNNRPRNLRYGTRKQNARDRDRHGRTVRGEAHWKAGITERQVNRAKRLLRRKERTGLPATYREIAKRCRMSEWVLYSIRTGRHWNHVKS